MPKTTQGCNLRTTEERETQKEEAPKKGRQNSRILHSRNPMSTRMRSSKEKWTRETSGAKELAKPPLEERRRGKKEEGMRVKIPLGYSQGTIPYQDEFMRLVNLL